jgi:electron transfer flavoprotein beta subunit
MNPTVCVLAGWHVHAVSGRPVRNGGDSVALALALAAAGPASVRLLTAGAMPERVARDYLAAGARHIEILEPTAPQHDIVPLLRPAVQNSALVLTGTRADGGLRSGALPHAIAAALRRPLVTDVVALQADAGGWIATQSLPRGARRRLRIAVPAVVAVHPAAPVALRHSFRDQLAGEVLRRTVPVPPPAPSPWRFVPPAAQLQRLQPRPETNGHRRMLGAVAPQQGATAGRVLHDGSADDKARAIFDYLQAHSLARF